VNWREEVRVAAAEVLREYPQVDRDLLEAIPIKAVGHFRIEPRWGAFFYRTRHIEVYQPAFDQMEDPENRAVQLRDVIRHEFDHALGRDADEHGRTAPALVPAGWLSSGPVAVTNGRITVHIP
jgi:hypothetical protein